MKKTFEYEKAGEFYDNMFKKAKEDMYIIGMQIGGMKGKELIELKKMLIENKIENKFLRRTEVENLFKSNDNDVELKKMISNAMLLAKGENVYKDVPLIIKYCNEREIESTCMIVIIYLLTKEGYRKYNVMSFNKHKEQINNIKIEKKEEGLIYLTKQLQKKKTEVSIRIIEVLKKCQHLIK